MDDPANDFDSVQWTREQERSSSPEIPQSPPQKLKSNGKRRQSGHNKSNSQSRPPDPAELQKQGFLECTVENPQKEADGTKEAYVSYLVVTNSDFKVFQKDHFSVRRRFTDFVYLYTTLFRQYPHIAVPPLPEKHNIQYVRGDRFATEFTSRRAHALNRFIRRITLHPVLRRNATFMQFLETPDWNATMRGKNMRASSIDGGQAATIGVNPAAASSQSAFESFQDWSINLFTKPHKPDKRFSDVREKANKLDEDLNHVEKIVARVARREGDLEADYADLATQFHKLVNMEPGVGQELTSFSSSVETTSQGMKKLREATDQDYLGSLRDMSSYVAALKALLKLREQKQVDFEALTDYLNKAANERDSLASHSSAGSLSGSAASFIRNKVEDVRGVDHEQSRRDRLRKTEMQIDRLTREVEEAKKTSEAFDEQVVNEVNEFERIKACEFKDTLGGLADAQMAFWRQSIDTWEEFLKGMEAEGGAQEEQQGQR
ncbi:MAG: hypothetical protein Q9162_001823 [Coniocarpon cinnabarinum]